LQQILQPLFFGLRDLTDIIITGSSVGLP